MKGQDFVILIKKIIVGLIITAVPLIIFLVGTLAGHEIFVKNKTTIMQLQKETKQKIFRDIIVSLFLYALPVILMFLSFYFTGKKPWLNQWKKNNTTIVNH